MTSGGTVIDWHITDPISDPPGIADGHYSERLYRLPKTAWCYRPPVNIPAEETPPIMRFPSRPFTFGSFNNCSKMSKLTFRMWAKVLLATPGSRMIIKASAMADEGTRNIIKAGFAEYGVGEERLMLLAQHLNLADHFAAYGDVDLALDTYTYHGTTTTCEALWMNVPVVTLTGNMHISRVGTSLLTNAGLPSLIASTEEEFIDIASRLANDTAALMEVRKGLRERFRKSPVMDDVQFASDFDAAMRTMWRDWCATQKK
jgi:protein O-GlcNAc transferase